MNEPQYTFGDVARICGVTEAAVRRWAKDRKFVPAGKVHCPRRLSGENVLTIYHPGLADIRADLDDEGNVLRVYPKVNGFRKLISIDPCVCFGAPVIAGTRIPTEILAGRFRGGDSVDELWCDYAVTKEQIGAALVYEGIAREVLCLV